MERRVLVEGASRGTVVVDREAATEHQPLAGAGGHGIQQPLGPGHRSGKLRLLGAGDDRRQMDQHVDAFEGAGEIARRAQVGPEHVHRGRPAERLQVRGRANHGPHFNAPFQQSAHHVAAKKAIGAGHKGSHVGCHGRRCSVGLKASTMRLTSITSFAATGRSAPSRSAR
jgi:hypothetical protein